jgi:hypothetical protein
MELVFEDPPCSIDDVIKLSYSFDNLHRFLNFLLLKDKESLTKIHDIGIKITEINELRTDLEEVTLRVTKFEGKFSEIENTINSFFQRFNELDKKTIGALHVCKFISVIFSFLFFFISRCDGCFL